jgi:hypothetical protein
MAGILQMSAAFSGIWITSLKIAEESTEIAHETRRDSDFMKMIVTLTICICQLSSCAVSSEPTSSPSPGRLSFVVSKIWRVYVASAVLLTLLTFECGSVDEEAWQERVEHSTVKTHIC